MKILMQYLIIFGCQLLGEALSRAFHISVPGNVMGMLILLLLMLTGVVKLDYVEDAANVLIKNLSLFFVPAGAGIMLYFSVLSKSGLAIAVSTIVSTLLVLIISGHTTQIFIKKGGDSNDRGDC